MDLRMLPLHLLFSPVVSLLSLVLLLLRVRKDIRYIPLTQIYPLKSLEMRKVFVSTYPWFYILSLIVQLLIPVHSDRILLKGERKDSGLESKEVDRLC